MDSKKIGLKERDKVGEVQLLENPLSVGFQNRQAKFRIMYVPMFVLVQLSPVRYFGGIRDDFHVLYDRNVPELSARSRSCSFAHIINISTGSDGYSN